MLSTHKPLARETNSVGKFGAKQTLLPNATTNSSLDTKTGGAAANSGQTPPAYYICNRCEKPGHWKKNCPTLNDPAFDQKKFSVGIPISRTRVITEGDAAALGDGVMRLPDGRLVQCMPSEYVSSSSASSPPPMILLLLCVRDACVHSIQTAQSGCQCEERARRPPVRV
eukprot:838354-Rhodomonas_salina.3